MGKIKNILKKLKSRQNGALGKHVIPRDQHGISRAQISSNALKVLYRLHNGGFQAHIVGGGVRDLLLGREPKDFDIATDAKPEQIRKLFRNCRLIIQNPVKRVNAPVYDTDVFGREPPRSGAARPRKKFSRQPGN